LAKVLPLKLAPFKAKNKTPGFIFLVSVDIPFDAKKHSCKLAIFMVLK
jgi:hypothetical protein